VSHADALGCYPHFASCYERGAGFALEPTSIELDLALNLSEATRNLFVLIQHANTEDLFDKTGTDLNSALEGVAFLMGITSAVIADLSTEQKARRASPGGDANT
jgi:hypothetical protein